MSCVQTIQDYALRSIGYMNGCCRARDMTCASRRC